MGFLTIVVVGEFTYYAYYHTKSEAQDILLSEPAIRPELNTYLNLFLNLPQPFCYYVTGY